MTDILEKARELGELLRGSEAWKALQETRTGSGYTEEQALAAQEVYDDLVTCVKQMIGLYVDFESARGCASCGGCPMREAGDGR